MWRMEATINTVTHNDIFPCPMESPVIMYVSVRPKTGMTYEVNILYSTRVSAMYYFYNTADTACDKIFNYTFNYTSNTYVTYTGNILYSGRKTDPLFYGVSVTVSVVSFAAIRH